MKKMDILGALVLRSRRVLDPARILNGDGLASGGDGARAFRDNSLGDTHLGKK